MAARVRERPDYLWVDELPERRQAVLRGEVLVAPSGGGVTSIPSGMIHDWVGAVFIPDVTAEQVLRVVQDYERYKFIYPPVVATSHALSRAGDHDSFSMRWVRKVLFVTAVFDTEHEARYIHLGGRQWYSIDDTTRVVQVENSGRPDERLLSADHGSGYLWRAHSVTRCEERDGGVYLEMEVVGLTRDVPACFRWLVNPVIAQLPRSLMGTTLEQTRQAVLAEHQRSGALEASVSRIPGVPQTSLAGSASAGRR